MSPDFLIYSVHAPPMGVLYIVTPRNAHALCWMIANTTPTQRPQHTIAHLDLDALRAFCQDAIFQELTFEDATAPQRNRITLIPGQPVLARFTGPHAGAIKAIFETDTIPTPYDSRQPRHDVLTAIQGQNPAAIIEWESTQPQHDPDTIEEFKRLLYER